MTIEMKMDQKYEQGRKIGRNEGEVSKEKELIEEIKFVNSKFEYDDKYKKFNKKFNYLDDGQSSKRVIEKIIF